MLAWLGTTMVPCRRLRAAWRRAGLTVIDCTSRLRTTSISSWASSAPRQWRRPPPNGIQSWDRADTLGLSSASVGKKRSGRKGVRVGEDTVIVMDERGGDQDERPDRQRVS